MKKYTLVPVVFLLLVLNSCSLFYIEEEEMPYIPTEDEIELTASVEEDAGYYIFTIRVDYLNSKVNSGYLNSFIEFDQSVSMNVKSIEFHALKHLSDNYSEYLDQDTNPQPDHPEFYEIFGYHNTENPKTVPGKNQENTYLFYFGGKLVHLAERGGFTFIQDIYWIPKNQDFRLDTLAIVIEHWDYTGSNSTKSVYKEIPFVHTMEGTAE